MERELVLRRYIGHIELGDGSQYPMSKAIIISNTQAYEDRIWLGYTKVADEKMKTNKSILDLYRDIDE